MSGRVRDAFRKRGRDAYSCDILPDVNDSEFHYEYPVEKLLDSSDWDLIIAHPPCDYLAVSGNRWYAERPDLYNPAAEFAKMFFNYAPMVCVENPVGRLSSLWRKPDQYIQPWMFGHPETKKTGLWLKNLPLLEPTDIVPKPEKGYEQNIWKKGPSKDRKIFRSLTYLGIAEAMAKQWGEL